MPDGRFAFYGRGCIIDLQDYGYIKREGEELELVPIPRPGDPTNLVCSLKYRTILWGDRLFLSAADDLSLQRFCRAGLTANRPSNPRDTYGGYLRDSDFAKPQTGVPRLPGKVWLKFLFDELTLRSDESSLRRAIESLLPGFARKGITIAL